MIPQASPDDPRVLEYGHVGDHAWLSERHLFVAEGRLLLERLFAAGTFRIVSVLVTPPAAAALAGPLGRVQADVLVVDPAVLKGVTGFDFHRGCLALVERPRALTLDDLPAQGCVVGLEGVGNPDNVGGLFRTAAAFDVAAMILDRTTGDPFYRKALRTSMGAALRLPFVRVPGWVGTIRRLREDGWIVAALTPSHDADPLDGAACDLASSPRRVLLAGSEGAGLSPETLAIADYRLRIPIASDVDSLNVTVAAGIALARLSR